MKGEEERVCGEDGAFSANAGVEKRESPLLGQGNGKRHPPSSIEGELEILSIISSSKLSSPSTSPISSS